MPLKVYSGTYMVTTSNVVCMILNVNSLYNATCVCIVCAVMLFHC
jgi:hypothetical protein